MASSEDETVEVGMDEERRLCELAGDDDEDDMREDREALFGPGRSVDDPMTVDGAEPDDESPLPLAETAPSAPAYVPLRLLSGMTTRSSSRR
ncbi:unnamed protein product [Urochloa humidicola]